jgi:hypothetical protein
LVGVIKDWISDAIMNDISFLEMELSFLRISEYLAEKLLSCGLRRQIQKWLNVRVLNKLTKPSKNAVNYFYQYLPVVDVPISSWTPFCSIYQYLPVVDVPISSWTPFCSIYQYLPVVDVPISSWTPILKYVVPKEWQTSRNLK